LDDSCRDKVVKSLAGRNNASPDVIAAVDGLMRQRFDAPPNADSAGQSRTEITSLDDLVGLSDDQIRALLENVEIDDLSLSLRVASQDVADAVLRNLPSATAQLMREQLQSSARLKIREVEDAQSKVVETMRQAALTGVGSQS
jgi:flagellar motor switch protein FliG